MAKLVPTGLIGSSSEKKKTGWHSRSLGSVQFSLAVQILDVQFGCSNFGCSSCSSISDVQIAFFLFWLPINPCSPLSATWKCLWLINSPVVIDWTCPFQVDKNHQCYVDPFWLTELYQPVLRSLSTTIHNGGWYSVSCSCLSFWIASPSLLSSPPIFGRWTPFMTTLGHLYWVHLHLQWGWL